MEVQPFYSLGFNEQLGCAEYVCAADHADLATARQRSAEARDADLLVDVGGEFALEVVTLSLLFAH
jgi:hypothetical protein